MRIFDWVVVFLIVALLVRSITAQWRLNRIERRIGLKVRIRDDILGLGE